MAQAGFHLNLAWHARAAETSAGREEARHEVTRAREILEANPAAKVVPEYFVKMESVAFEQGWTREAFSQVFEEAIARERDDYTTYLRAAYFPLNGVRSERGGWERFAEEQRRRRGGEEGDAL